MTMPWPLPMMECGHAANSLLTVGEDQIPACVICHGTHPGSSVIADPQPDMVGWKARCTYFGTIPKGRNHESNYGCKRGQICDCEQDSRPDLPFFQRKPAEEFDSFFCGCWGWD